MGIIDLSHTTDGGTKTYNDLSPKKSCDYASQQKSTASYSSRTKFPPNPIKLTGLVIRAPHMNRWSAIGVSAFKGKLLKGRAILVDTGWSKHFGSDLYIENHSFITEEAAEYLIEQEVALVGIDSHNIDDVRSDIRPVHSALLSSQILIVEHLANLTFLPDQGFNFFTESDKISDAGYVPTQAYAILH